MSPKEFDDMIEMAVNLPRRYGYAPTNEELFKNPRERLQTRLQQFMEIDTNHDGRISFDEWLKYATEHIVEKVAGLDRDPLVNGSKQDFVYFLKEAMHRDTEEYVELYFFLLKIFVMADTNKDGRVDHVEFDKMVETAVLAPRRHGLAPPTEKMFSNDHDRIAKRKVQFDKMDTDKNDTISFSEWLEFAMDHIMGKVAEANL